MYSPKTLGDNKRRCAWVETQCSTKQFDVIYIYVKIWIQEYSFNILKSYFRRSFDKPSTFAGKMFSMSINIHTLFRISFLPIDHVYVVLIYIQTQWDQVQADLH